MCKKVKPHRPTAPAELQRKSIGVMGVLVKRMAVLLSSVCFLCAASQSASAEGGVLRVGIAPDFPPYEYHQPACGSYTGFEVELIEALAPLMGYGFGVSFVNAAFEDLMDGLDADLYDVAIAGFSVTPEREKRVAFSKPYITDGFKIVVPNGSDYGEDAAAMKGRRVAVERGSYASELARRLGEPSEVIGANDTEEALNMTLDGRADCAMASSAACAFFLANGYGDRLKFSGDAVLAPDEIAAAVRKNNAELLSKLNAALARYKNSSAYEMLYRTYFGTPAE